MSAREMPDKVEGVRAKVHVELAERLRHPDRRRAARARRRLVKPLLKQGRERVFVVADEQVARLHLRFPKG